MRTHVFNVVCLAAIILCHAISASETPQAIRLGRSPAGGVLLLRRISETLVLQETLPKEKRSTEAVYRFPSYNWVLKRPHFRDSPRAKDASHDVAGDGKPMRGRSRKKFKSLSSPDSPAYGYLLAEHAETYAMFDPEKLASCSDVISNNIVPSEKLSFLTALLDQYCRRKGWRKCLSANLDKEQKQTIDRLTQKASEKKGNPDTQISRLTKMLQPHLPERAVRRAVAYILLYKHYHADKGGKRSNDKDFLWSLANKHGYRVPVLRWLTLCNATLHSGTVKELSHPTGDDSASWRYRCAAIRLHGLKGKSQDFFKKYKRKLSEELPRREIKNYKRKNLREVWRWSQAVFKFRHQGFSQILKNTINSRPSIRGRELGVLFYPKKYFLSILTELEERQEEIQKGAHYQRVLQEGAREMCKRGMFTDKLKQRLKQDLFTLKPKQRRIILLSAIHGTLDLETFTRPILKYYKENRQNFEIDKATVPHQVLARLELMAKQQDMDIIEYLKEQADKNRYRKYRDTIKEVTQRIKDIRAYSERLRKKSYEDPEQLMEEQKNKGDHSTNSEESLKKEESSSAASTQENKKPHPHGKAAGGETSISNGTKNTDRLPVWASILGVVAVLVIIIACRFLWRKRQ